MNNGELTAAETELTAIGGWHYEALRLHLMGFTPGQIVETLGCPANALRTLLNSKLAQAALDAIHAKNLETLTEAQTTLQALLPLAIDELRNELTSPNEEVRHKAARWLAEAAGCTPVRRVEVRKGPLPEDPYDDLSIEELRARALEKIRQGASIETTARPMPEPDPATPVQ